MMFSRMNAQALENLRPIRWTDPKDLNEKEESLKLLFPETPEEKLRREKMEEHFHQKEEERKQKEAEEARITKLTRV